MGENTLTFIKGPPGCGKTRTVGRLCRLLLEEGQRVLVGTVSNVGNISIAREVVRELGVHNNHNAALKMTEVQWGEWGPINLVIFTCGQLK